MENWSKVQFRGGQESKHLAAGLKKPPIFQPLPGPSQFLKQQGLTLQHNPQKNQKSKGRSAIRT